MLDLKSVPALQTCARCATELPSFALACPACAALVHRDRLTQLAERATAAMTSGDKAAARELWLEARELVPGQSEQYRLLTARATALADESSRPPTPGPSDKSWWTSAAGAAAAVGLLLVGKFKFLLLGLSKLSTVVSMFGFIAVYWSIHGWPLAVGLAGSIYIHEMGHVAMLRRLGIRADAPLFIPGVGALVMLREHVTDPVANARIGLAGPVWGLCAGIASWATYLVTGASIWLAIAELTGFLNLFNLMPIWQLDGARGFQVLARDERWIVLIVIGLALWATGVGVLWIVGGVALYHTVRGEAGPGHRATAVTFAGLVLALSWLARSVG